MTLGSAKRESQPRRVGVGVGLGWRKAQRRGLGTAEVPKTKSGWIVASQPRDFSGGFNSHPATS